MKVFCSIKFSCDSDTIFFINNTRGLRLFHYYVNFKCYLFQIMKIKKLTYLIGFYIIYLDDFIIYSYAKHYVLYKT